MPTPEPTRCQRPSPTPTATVVPAPTPPASLPPGNLVPNGDFEDVPYGWAIPTNGAVLTIDDMEPAQAGNAVAHLTATQPGAMTLGFAVLADGDHPRRLAHLADLGAHR